MTGSRSPLGELVRAHRARLQLSRELRMPLYAAQAHERLGTVEAASGEPEAANTTWRAALAMFEALDAPEAEDLTERLRERYHQAVHQTAPLEGRRPQARNT